MAWFRSKHLHAKVCSMLFLLNSFILELLMITRTDIIIKIKLWQSRLFFKVNMKLQIHTNNLLSIGTGCNPLQVEVLKNKMDERSLGVWNNNLFFSLLCCWSIMGFSIYMWLWINPHIVHVIILLVSPRRFIICSDVALSKKTRSLFSGQH